MTSWAGAHSVTGNILFVIVSEDSLKGPSSLYHVYPVAESEMMDEKKSNMDLKPKPS